MRDIGTGATYLPDNSALKHDQHEQGEQTVIPIFVQTPEGDAEDLEHEEGCCGVFREQFGERWDGNVEFIIAIQLLEFWDSVGLEGGRLQKSV